MNDAFNGLISRLDTTEERISELEDISTETFKTENQRGGKTKKERERISKTHGTATKGMTCM